ADVILHLRDATTPASELEMDASIAARLPPRTPVLTVLNKIDLLSDPPASAAGVLPISAHTGAGLPELRAELLGIAGWNPATESPYLARERHLAALAATADSLEAAALHAAQDDRVLDLFAEE